MKRAFISNSRLQRLASCFNIMFSKKHFFRKIIHFPFKNKFKFRWNIFCLEETIKIIRGRFYHYLKRILRKLYSVHRTNLMSNYFFTLFHTSLKLPINEPFTCPEISDSYLSRCTVIIHVFRSQFGSGTTLENNSNKYEWLKKILMNNLRQPFSSGRSTELQSS